MNSSVRLQERQLNVERGKAIAIVLVPLLRGIGDSNIATSSELVDSIAAMGLSLVAFGNFALAAHQDFDPGSRTSKL
jgi:hypothetical protein